MVTEFLKVFEGRKRPNFYAMCNYHGYRDALTSGNYDAYLAATEPGRPGSMANCLETDIVGLLCISFPNLYRKSCEKRNLAFLPATLRAFGVDSRLSLKQFFIWHTDILLTTVYVAILPL